MADEVEDIIVDIENSDVTDEGSEKKQVIDPDDGIADLKRQLDAERAARRAAEMRAHEATTEVIKARSDVDESNLHLVNSAIDALSRDNDVLKTGYQHAMTTGDFGRAAEIQQEMSSNAAKLLQLENGRDAMVAKPKQAVPPPVSADPVEAFAGRLSPQSADWVRKHPEFVRDARLNRKMIRAHEDAMDDGISVDTPEYFAAIEEKLGVKAKTVQEQSQTDDKYAATITQRRDAAPAAAPVTRGAPSGKNIVRLTAAEREMAEMMGMKPEDYAKNKVALQREGRIG